MPAIVQKNFSESPTHLSAEQYYHLLSNQGGSGSGFSGSFTDLSDKPTTLAGYGITDAQPHDPDLDAIAALTTNNFGLQLLTKSDADSVRSYIGAGSSSFSGAFSDLSGKPTTLSGYGITDAQPNAANLDTLAGMTLISDSLLFVDFGSGMLNQLTFAANEFPARASSGHLQNKTISNFGLSLVDDADASTARTTLGLAIGLNVQAYALNLDAWAAIGPATGIGTFLATPSSANLAAAVTDETGSGALVFANTPTLVTPLLGTPTSGVLTNCSGTASGLTAGLATALATGRTLAITGDLMWTSPSFDGSGNVTAAGTVTKASGAFALPATITAPDISADTDDWAPTGIGSCFEIVFDSNGGDWNLTSMAGGSVGQVRQLRYQGLNGGSITINSDAGGSAGNRFKTYSDIPFKFGGANGVYSTLTVRHDGTYWRPLSLFNGATSSGVTSFEVENGVVVGVNTNAVPAIMATARATSQTAANSSVTTYTDNNADGSFRVWMNMRVASATAVSTTMRVTYTDEGGTSRNVIFPVHQTAGTLIAAGAITTTGVWHTIVIPIRAKVSTAITLLVNTGTFTSVNYAVEGFIEFIGY